MFPRGNIPRDAPPACQLPDSRNSLVFSHSPGMLFPGLAEPYDTTPVLRARLLLQPAQGRSGSKVQQTKVCTMGLFTGRKGLVLGIANERSIAWAITENLHREGAEMGFTHMPDAGDRPKNQNKVAKLVDPIGSKFLRFIFAADSRWTA